MDALRLIPVFMIGLLGSVHCVGMCGGVVAAFSSTPERRFPLPVGNSLVQTANFSFPMAGVRTLAYNIGRLSSYALAGAIVGGLANGIGSLAQVAQFQIAAASLVNGMLIALGLYLMDIWRGIAQLERLGQHIWRHLKPLMKFILPPKQHPSPFRLMLLGALWGWLPCGMVYSVLITAMFSGSATSGALLMLAFGAGTLPMLLAMGLLGVKMKQVAQRRPIRLAAGLVVLCFGLLGFMRNSQFAHLSASWLCIGPSMVAQ